MLTSEGHYCPHFLFHSDFCAVFSFYHSNSRKLNLAKIWCHQKECRRISWWNQGFFWTRGSQCPKDVEYPCVSLESAHTLIPAFWVCCGTPGWLAWYSLVVVDSGQLIPLPYDHCKSGRKPQINGWLWKILCLWCVNCWSFYYRAHKSKLEFVVFLNVDKRNLSFMESHETYMQLGNRPI